MARRPIFIPSAIDTAPVRQDLVEFDWFPGFAISQKQKSIDSLHRHAARSLGPGPYLEISSKSTEYLGVQLSAFNLQVEGFADHPIPVENAFQGSKVFSDGRGPFPELYAVSPLQAKRDLNVRIPDPVIRFQTPRETWPNVPRTAFYDWVYLKALTDAPHLLRELRRYTGFTDIEFNPERSINCQAHSCALATSLDRRGLVEDAMEDQASFIRICYPDTPIQESIWD